MARQQQFSAFRAEQNENIRQIAEAATDEAFLWFYQQTGNPQSAAGKWLIEKTGTPLKIPLALTSAYAPKFIRSDLKAVLSAQARIVDFRNTDSKNTSFQYTPDARDGLGTVEIQVTADLLKGGLTGGQKLTSCKISRHHDYLVVSMISPRKNDEQRNGYSHCFPLDYALFLRNGLEEFRQTKGLSLNHRDVHLTLFQDNLPVEKRGKVYIGETDLSKGSTAHAGETPTQNYVFFNVGEDFKNQVIPFKDTRKVGIDDAMALMPFLKRELDKEKAKDSRIKDLHWEGVEGVFELSTEPLPKKEYASQAAEVEAQTLMYLCKISDGAEGNIPIASGQSIVSGDPDKAMEKGFVESILEGTLRKRFFYYVYFWLDMTNARIKGYGEEKKFGKTFRQDIDIPFPPDEAAKFKKPDQWVPCVPIPPEPGRVPANPDQEVFAQALKIISGRFPGNPLLSRFEASFNYGGNTGDLVTPPPKEQFNMPRFFNSKGQTITVSDAGSNGLRPYNHFNLWYRKLIPPARLKEIGIIDQDKGLIHLRGIVHVQGDLTLDTGNGRPWKIDGQGVLVGDNIRINTGIQKTQDSDLCVLLTRKGMIFVDTDQRIEAVLIALTDTRNGAVKPSKPLDLKGALIADVLGTTAWVKGEHKIEYDPLLKSPTEYQYQTNLSRWVTFERISEN